MLNGTHFFECMCGGDEHILRFTLNFEDKEIYTSVYLSDWMPWYKKFWLALKYVCGTTQGPYGHFSNWVMDPNDVDRLHAMLHDFIHHNVEAQPPLTYSVSQAFSPEVEKALREIIVEDIEKNGL